MTCARREAGARRPAPSAESRSRPDPRPGLSRALFPFRLLPVLALLLGAFSPFAAAPTAADVLVSNIGQTTEQSFSTSGQAVAQAFTTGSHTDGYRLDSIEALLQYGAGGQVRETVRAELWSAATNSKITSLTVPSSVPAGTVSFEAPSNTRLTASTTYFFVLYTTGNDSIGPWQTTSHDEDAGSLAGWSIANNIRWINSNTPTGIWGTFNKVIKIRVNGREGWAGTPTGLRAAPGNGELHLSWTAPSSGTVTGYDVSYTSDGATRFSNPDAPSGTDPSSGWADAGHTGTAAKLTIKNLRNRQYYYLRVRAKNDSATSPYVFGNGTPSAGAPPGEPTDFKVTPAPGELTVSWTAPPGSLLKYTMQYKKTAENWAAGGVARPAATATSYRITGLDAGVSYDVRLHAQNAGGQSGWVYGSGTPLAPPPVRKLRLAPGNAQVGVRFDAPVASTGYTLTAYTVQYKKSADATWRTYSRTRRPGADQYRFPIEGLDNEVSWDVRVRAHYGSDTSAWVSGSATPTATPAPGAPQDLRVASVTLTRVEVSWTAPAGTVTGYEVHYTSADVNTVGDTAAAGTDPATGWAAVTRGAETDPPTASQDIAGLTTGTVYRVRVRAVNGARTGDWAFHSGAPGTQPIPVGLTAEAGPGKVTLFWNPGGGSHWRNRFAIEYGEHPGGDTTQVLTGRMLAAKLSYPISDLAGGTTYRFRVRQQGRAFIQGPSHGPWTDWVTATPLAAPGTPGNLRVTPRTTALDLSWTAPSGTVTGYDVHYTSSSIADRATAGTNPATSWVPVPSRTATDTSVTQSIASLTTGTAYRVRVRARNANGGGAWVFGAGTPGVLAAPTDLKAVPGFGTLDLSWTKPLGRVTGYDVQITSSAAVADGAAARVDRDYSRGWAAWGGRGSTDTATTEKLNSLLYGTAFRIRVRARNDSEPGTWAFATVSTLAPAAPTGLVVTPGSTKLDLAWTAASSAGTVSAKGYDVHYTASTTVTDGAAPGGNPATNWVAVSRGTENFPPTAAQAIPGLTNDTPYRVRVRAKYLSGNSGNGAWAFGSGTPKASTSGSTDATLSALVLKDDSENTIPFGTFAGTTYAYSVDLGAVYDEVTITPTVNESNAGVKVGKGTDLTAVASGSASGAIALGFGANRITVEVTAQAGNKRAYTITVNRALPEIAFEFSTLSAQEGAEAAPRLAASFAVDATSVPLSYAATGVANPAGLTDDVGSGRPATLMYSGSSFTGISVPITDDTLNEEDETFTVTIGPGTGYTLGSPATVTVTITDNDPPAAPGSFGVTPGNARLYAAWAKPDGPVTGYQVRHKETAAADQAATTAGDPSTGWVTATPDGAGITAEIAGLTNGTGYDVQVRATDGQTAAGNGYGPWTATQAGTPTSQVPAPSDVAVDAGDASFTVTWAAFQGAGTYQVQWGPDSAQGFPNSDVASAPATSFTASSDAQAPIVNGTVHKVRVRVCVGADCGGWSATLRFTPQAPAGPDDRHFNVRAREGVWSADLNVDRNGNAYGCDDSDPDHADCFPRALSNRNLAYKGTTYTVKQVYTVQSGGTSTLTVVFEPHVPNGPGTLYVGEDTRGSSRSSVGAGVTALSIANAQASGNGWTWVNTGLDWSGLGARLWLRLVMHPRVSLSVDPAAVAEGSSAIVTATLDTPWNASADPLAIPVTVTTGTAEDGDWSAQPFPESYPNQYFGKQRSPQAEIYIDRGDRTGTLGIRHVEDGDTDSGETLTVALASTLPCKGEYIKSCVEAGATTSVDITLNEAPPSGAATAPPTVGLTQELHELIRKIEGWRDDPALSGHRPHVVRWNRVLLAFGWPVSPASDGSLAPMTAAEAQTYADRGWTRWVEVAEALREIEGPPPPLADPVVTIAGGGPVTEGAPAGFTLTASRAPAADLAVAVSVAQSGAFADASALGARTVTIPAGGTSAALTVATVDDTADEADGAIAATLGTGSGYTLGDAKRATVKVADNDEDNPDIVTKRATAREGTDEAAVFMVRLSHAASTTVTVDWATADGAGPWAGTAPATAGADYTASSGTLTFAPGERLKSVRVPILDDAIDEGMEHFLLRFSNPVGATLEARYRETQGLIMNDDHLQSTWLSRFGRTAGSQVADAVSERLEGGLAPGTHATLAGRPLDLADAEDGTVLTDAMTALALALGAREAPPEGAEGPLARHDAEGPSLRNAPAATIAARSATGREILRGSSFHVAPSRGPGLSAWGRVAHGRFDGVQADGTGRTRLDGEVTTGILGVDAEWKRLLAGVAVSLSEGEGRFESLGADVGASGDVETTMTTVSPYARFRVTGRVTAWGLAGRGTGGMTLRFDDGSMAPVRTGLSMRLGAVGARGALLEQDASGGMDLALKADALFVRTESEAVANSAPTEAGASRVRLVLEAGRAFGMGGGATLRPSLELGLRRDGGDAETGTGVEIGGGLAWSAPSSRVTAALRARALAAHAASEYSEWGVSGTLRIAPDRRGRGLSLSLTSGVGLEAGGADAVWSARNAAALVPGAASDPSARLDAEVGYGLPAMAGRFTGTPYAGLSATGAEQGARVGWRLTRPADPEAFRLDVEAGRREASGGGGPGNGIGFRFTSRW